MDKAYIREQNFHIEQKMKIWKLEEAIKLKIEEHG